MTPELKAKWVAALRSDEFQQGYGTLRNDHRGTYCCLGVLRHVVDPKDERGSVQKSVLSPEQLNEFGLDHATAIQLWKMNDGEGCRPHTFVEIADWIEANVDVDVEATA